MKDLYTLTLTEAELTLIMCLTSIGQSTIRGEAKEVISTIQKLSKGMSPKEYVDSYYSVTSKMIKLSDIGIQHMEDRIKKMKGEG